MKCFICEHAMSPYFSKTFTVFNLGCVDYWKCGYCGAVISKSHLKMTKEEWEKINIYYHSSYHGGESCPDDPRWFERLKIQADKIKKLTNSNIITRNLSWVDYGCRDGKLADLLNNHGLSTLKFDHYFYDEVKGYISYGNLIENKYSLVLNTSFFEHVLNIEILDEIASLVDNETGVLAVHTLVNENVPKDPNWFYLLPVHTSFYTNKSMQILFERWDFKQSLYHVSSRMWFWFKKKTYSEREIKKKLVDSGEIWGNDEWYYKEGFVNYWQ